MIGSGSGEYRKLIMTHFASVEERNRCLWWVTFVLIGLATVLAL